MLSDNCIILIGNLPFLNRIKSRQYSQILKIACMASTASWAVLVTLPLVGPVTVLAAVQMHNSQLDSQWQQNMVLLMMKTCGQWLWRTDCFTYHIHMQAYIKPK